MSGLFNDYLKEISKVSYWIWLDRKPSKLTNSVMGRRLEGQQGSVHIWTFSNSSKNFRVIQWKRVSIGLSLQRDLLNVFLLFSFIYISSLNTGVMSSLKEICAGLPLDPLPPNRGRDPSVPHAPVRTPNLTPAEERVGQHISQLCSVIWSFIINEHL